MKYLIILAIVAIIVYSMVVPSTDCFTYVSDLANNHQKEINEIVSLTR